jgi:peptidyl-prolyl cis-trans isomerase SurA
MHRNLIKIFLLVFLYFQNSISYSAVKNKIIANVESQIVSSYELKNKIRTILILSNQALDQNNIDKSKGLALNSLVDYKLKKEEISKHSISINDEAVDNHLRTVSSKYNTDIKGLKELFKKSNLDFDFYLDEIKTEFSWQKIIFDIYNKKISLDESEINKELNDYIKTQKNIDEFKLSEIEISLNETTKRNEKINEINNQINKIGFANTAIKYSTSSSALDGGNIGWVSSKSLSDQIKNSLEKAKTGDVIKPFIKSNSILFIRLLDKKTTSINNVNVDELRKKIIDRKKNEIFNLYSNSHLSKLKNNAFIEFKN